MALHRRAFLGLSSPFNIIKGQLGVTVAFPMLQKPTGFHRFMCCHIPEYPFLDPNAPGMPHECPLNAPRQRPEYPRRLRNAKPFHAFPRRKVARRGAVPKLFKSLLARRHGATPLLAATRPTPARAKKQFETIAIVNISFHSLFEVVGGNTS